MFDKEKLEHILASYKRDFVSIEWPNEGIKWRAVKHFQDHWDLDASDFPQMLKEALAGTRYKMQENGRYKYYDLIYFQSKQTITQLAAFSPEKVKAMFFSLYDETKDIYRRFDDFKADAASVFRDYQAAGHTSQKHLQTEAAISAYLWLRYPDKYYIYKIRDLRKLSEILDSSYSFEYGSYRDNLENCFSFYNEIRQEIRRDDELLSAFRGQLTADCYPDPLLTTLAMDLGYYISHRYQAEVNPAPAVSPSPNETSGVYTREQFLSKVFLPPESYDELHYLLERKQNVILQGPPGVGKTFAARKLAYAFMGEKDESRVGFIQFHQNYSYEDFILGYKPDADGFQLKEGVFYKFCRRAANYPKKSFFFIIDEINRGNLSKIFGELFMLIEKNYRGKTVPLPYDNDRSFTIPPNIYLIGTMNTADRSLAMMDYALRRRFSFFPLEPGFESDGFKQYQNEIGDETFNRLVEMVKELNQAISTDSSLGGGFCIGHSYFCGMDKTQPDRWMKSVVKYEIIPLLMEYWFDEPDKVKEWKDKLFGVFHNEV